MLPLLGRRRDPYFGKLAGSPNIRENHNVIIIFGTLWAICGSGPNLEDFRLGEHGPGSNRACRNLAKVKLGQQPSMGVGGALRRGWQEAGWHIEANHNHL